MCDIDSQKLVGCKDEKRYDGNDGNDKKHKREDRTVNRNRDPKVDPPPERRTPEECAENWQNMLFCFEHRDDDKKEDEDEDEEHEPRTPTFTITDVATFAPDPTPVRAEPGNAGVEGLPANFVATATTQVKEGELLGYPISVRFTPQSFEFHYGDGSSRTTTTGGTSWADLGQAQFTPTATSYAYAQRGTYDTRVDVDYSAEVGYAGQWVTLAGVLTIEGSVQSIRIYEANTALVDRTCQEQPAALGC